MMSCTASAAWSCHVSSPCYIEYGQRCGTVLSGRITTVAMSRSDLMGLRCTVEPNCSGLSARLPDTSVTRDHALDTCVPSCVSGAARYFFIPVVHSPLEAMWYVAAPKLSFWGGEVGVEEHVTASELNSVRRRGPGLRDTW
jgi:hypothetical protein